MDNKNNKPGLTAKGKPIPNTVEEWQYYAWLLGDVIIKQRKIIGDQKHLINTLQQKLSSKEKHS